MPTPRVTIDELPEQGTIDNTDLLLIQDGAISKKMQVGTLINGATSGLATHLADTTAAHAATAVSTTNSGSGIDGTDVQAQLGQLATAVATAATGDFLPTTGGSVTGDVDVTGAFDVTGAASVTAGDIVLDGSHCVVAPCVPTLDTHLTNKLYVDGILVDGGGGTGIEISDTPPDDHDILWADTSDEADLVADTVIVYTYTDETDLRPTATVVFWIPDPYTLDDPFGALDGDLVLRTTPDVVQGLNGISGLWQGTAAEYEALPIHDATTVYFIIA